MQVLLKVLGGKNDGREITITNSEFIIGRGEKAHLKPSSDLISREHCAIRLDEGRVFIEDMGSRNGTFVNSKQLTEKHEASTGDNLRVGRLQFELRIDHGLASIKKPKVTDIAEAARRTVDSDKPEGGIEDSISEWLDDMDDDDDLNRDNIKNIETVQFNLDDLQGLTSETIASSSVGSDSVSDDSMAETPEDDSKGKKKKKKKEYGKLPKMSKLAHEDSTTAADDVLKRFFNRR